MRRMHVVALLLVLPLAGCGASSNNKGKIEDTTWSSGSGTWEGKGQPPGYLKLAFNADGSFVYTVPDSEYRGKYVLGSGDTVTLEFDEDFNGSKVHKSKIAIKDDELTLTDTDGKEMKFYQPRKATPPKPLPTRPHLPPTTVRQTGAADK